MRLRSDHDDRGGARHCYTAACIHVAVVVLLAGSSLVALERLVGSLIGQLPEAGANRGVSRVERWAAFGSGPAASGAPVVRGWVTRTDVPRPAIPMSAIAETELWPVPPRAALAAPTASIAPLSEPVAAPVDPSATYRTVCVRLCDGAYFPLSFATTADWFAADEQRCRSSCRAPARLFMYRNPGERPDQMVDRDGRSYASFPRAFQFRAHYDENCSCKGQPWGQEAMDRHLQYGASQPEGGGGPAAALEASINPAKLASLTGTSPPAPVAPMAIESTLRGDADDAIPALPQAATSVPPIAAVELTLPQALTEVRPEISLANPPRVESTRKAAKRVLARPQRTRRDVVASARPAYPAGRYASRYPGEIVRRSLMAGF